MSSKKILQETSWSPCSSVSTFSRTVRSFAGQSRCQVLDLGLMGDLRLGERQSSGCHHFDLQKELNPMEYKDRKAARDRP